MRLLRLSTRPRRCRLTPSPAGLWLIAAAWALLPAAASGAPDQAPAKPVQAAPAPPSQVPADRLASVARSDRLVWSGVVVAPDRRVFVVSPRVAGGTGPALAVIDAQGAATAFPGAGWDWTAGDAKADPAHSFVGPSAIRLAPDNSLWVVDSGVPGFGRPMLPGAAKLVRIDLASLVTRSYVLPPEVLRPKSLLAEMRFNGGRAYISDAGAPGLIVLDLADGSARRLLDGDPSTTGQRPVVVDGEILRGGDNKPVMIHADQLEVSPDGKYLYFQPLPGPMSRIPTALLDNARASPRAVAAGVQFWYDTPALGGSAIGADGTLYLDDVEHDSVLSLTPDRVLATVVRDPRLHWPASPFLARGVLTLPVAQLDRAAAFHHGRSQIRLPVEMFGLRVAAPPPGTPH